MWSRIHFRFIKKLYFLNSNSCSNVLFCSLWSSAVKPKKLFHRSRLASEWRMDIATFGDNNPIKTLNFFNIWQRFVSLNRENLWKWFEYKNNKIVRRGICSDVVMVEWYSLILVALDGSIVEVVTPKHAKVCYFEVERCMFSPRFADSQLNYTKMILCLVNHHKNNLN